MTAVPLGSFVPGSEEWDDVRRFRLGGSEVAAVLGLSPWDSRLSLWLKKRGLIPSQSDNPLLEWGRRIEPVVRDKFIEDHPGTWQPNPGVFVSAERYWQLGSPDALKTRTAEILKDPTADADKILGLLEVKTAARAEGWGDDRTDEIPVHYRAQVLQYVDVFGLDGAWVAALIHGTDYRVYRINRDDDDIAILREEGERFVTDLINNRAPDIDRHSATYRALRELHPDILPGQVEVDPELAGDYLAAYMAWKDGEVDKDYYAAQILQEMGNLKDAVVAEEDGGVSRFAYRTHKSKNGMPGTPYLAVDQTRYRQLTYPKTLREALSV